MKNGLVLLLGCAMVMSAGAAGAQDGRQARETREPRVDPIPETTDYSFCDETGGGLECGRAQCGESSYESTCETWVINTTSEDWP